MPKVHGKEASERTTGTIGIPRTDIVVIGQDNRFMRRIVHPPGNCTLGDIILPRTSVDDLATPTPGITGLDLPLPISGSIRPVMRQKIIDRLVVAMQAGRDLQGIGLRQRRQAGFDAFVVDQGDHLVFKSAIMDQTAA